MAYTTAILDDVVLSASSFALFFSKACCRQLSKFWQLWCSGIRCYKKGGVESEPKQDKYGMIETHRAAEFSPAVRTLAYNPESCLVAAGLSLEVEDNKRAVRGTRRRASIYISK